MWRSREPDLSGRALVLVLEHKLLKIGEEEAYPILAGNMIMFFHLEDTPMAKKVKAQAKVAVW